MRKISVLSRRAPVFKGRRRRLRPCRHRRHLGCARRPPPSSNPSPPTPSRSRPTSAVHASPRVQNLMGQRKVAALLIEPGSSLEYFTGNTPALAVPSESRPLQSSRRRERCCGGDAGLRGAPPYRKHLAELGGDAATAVERTRRAPASNESFRALRDRGIRLGGVGEEVEPTTRFFIVDGIRQVSKAYEMVSAATPWCAHARLMEQSPAGAIGALAATANNVTHRGAALPVRRKIDARHTRSGGDRRPHGSARPASSAAPEFSLVLLNEASAYPHGSLQDPDGARRLDGAHGLRLHGAWLSI